MLLKKIKIINFNPLKFNSNTMATKEKTKQTSDLLGNNKLVAEPEFNEKATP